MLEIAREEIFIADWWLCPEIYMKRPMAEGMLFLTILEQLVKNAIQREFSMFRIKQHV